MVPYILAAAGCGPVRTFPGVPSAYVFPRSGPTQFIWCDGDSITLNANSTNNCRYRKNMYDWFTANGYLVDFIGTIVTGTFPNPVHDGHSGFDTAGIYGNATAVYTGHLPVARLIRSMVGTNDCVHGAYNGAAAAVSEDAYLRYLIGKSIASTRYLVCKIPPAGAYSGDPVGSAPNVIDLNSRKNAVWDGIDSYLSSLGRPPLIRSDWHAAFGGVWTSALFGADTLHPNDAGYDLGWSTDLAAITAAGIIEP